MTPDEIPNIHPSVSIYARLINALVEEYGDRKLSLPELEIIRRCAGVAEGVYEGKIEAKE
jgi:hypothetical protein